MKSSVPSQIGTMKKKQNFITIEFSIGNIKEMNNLENSNQLQEEEVEGEQEVMNRIEADQELEEADTFMGGGADPQLGMMIKIKNGMKDIVDGMSHKKQTQDMKKIGHKKEKEDTIEKNMMIEDMMIETSRGLLVEVRTAECTKITEEDLAAEIDQTVLEDMEDTKMTEKIVEEGQQRQVDTQAENMKQKIERKTMIRREQEAQLPEEENTEKTALIMNMDMKEKEEEVEEVTHLRQDTEVEIPATIDEGGAQGP